MPLFVRRAWPVGHGEKLLLAAVFRRAAFDIALYKGHPRLNKRRLWKDAYDWLMSDQDSHFLSFISVCTVLEQDPAELRSKTVRLRREDVRKYDMVS